MSKINEAFEEFVAPLKRASNPMAYYHAKDTWRACAAFCAGECRILREQAVEAYDATYTDELPLSVTYNTEIATIDRILARITDGEGKEKQAMSEEKCMKCDGCGKITNDDDGSPWSLWEAMPFESKVVVRMGLVKPLKCPKCNGTGKVTR